MVSPTAKWTAKSVSNSNGVTTQMAMWKRIAIFHEETYADRLVLSVSPQAGKDNRVFIGIVIVCGRVNAVMVNIA